MSDRPGIALQVAVLVKQIPALDTLTLGSDGRLLREGLELEMNPYCRRAVAQGAELAARTGGRVTILSLGPPSAEDTVREAVAWADAHGAAARGVLVSDPRCAGSDTLATARALAAVLRREGPFDLVLCGLSSVDSDTGQVGPEVAELLDLPFATGVKQLVVGEGEVAVVCELDDGRVDAVVRLPALLSCAERLCDPAKVPAAGRAAVDASRITVLDATALGEGPWGSQASPTWVGEVRVLASERSRRRAHGGSLEAQVDDVVALLVERGALREDEPLGGASAVIERVRIRCDGPMVAVLVEPGRERLARELLGAAAELAAADRGWVCAVIVEPQDPLELSSWGADEVLALLGSTAEEDIGRAVGDYARAVEPWAVLAPSTAWGREVAGRAAARAGAGLTGDAVGLEEVERRLVAWKPAFGGQLVAAIGCASPVQMATVRPGVLPLRSPRVAVPIPVASRLLEPFGRVVVTQRSRDDDVEVLANARRVVGVGQGVDPAAYVQLEPLLEVLGAELGCTRKVTDAGWLPRSRQIGITGRSIAPALYLALGTSGRFNHMVGVRAAGTVVAVNPDPGAEVFDVSDIGICGHWQDVVPLLTDRVRAALAVGTR